MPQASITWLTTCDTLVLGYLPPSFDSGCAESSASRAMQCKSSGSRSVLLVPKICCFRSHRLGSNAGGRPESCEFILHDPSE